MTKSKRKFSKFTQAQKNRWVQKYLDGESSHTIARSEGTLNNVVLQELKKQNVPRRPSGLCHQQKNTLGEKSYFLRMQNLTWVEIGDMTTNINKTSKSKETAASSACTNARNFAISRKLTWPPKVGNSRISRNSRNKKF